MAKISKKTSDTTIKLTGKFSKNFMKVIKGGASASKESDVSFTGKAKEQKGVNSTATKIKPLKQGNELIDMLMKIYDFMDKTHKEDTLKNEESNNFKEGQKIADDKRHQKLIKAIEQLTKNNDIKPETAEKIEETSGMDLGDVVNNILNAFGGAKTALNIISKVGGFFLSPLGLGLIAGASLFTLLAIDKNPEETNKMIQNAGGGTGNDAATIQDVVENTSEVERRKQNLLADRPSNKKSMLPWKDPKLQAEYLKEIGFDESTGLTKAEKDQGYTKLDEKGLPAKNEIANITNSIPSTPSSTVAGTSTPSASTSLSTPSTPTATPSVPISSKLNDVQSENNTAKIDDMTGSSSVSVNNSNVVSTPDRPTPRQRSKIPPVRNMEESFQKMIIYSTRVV